MSLSSAHSEFDPVSSAGSAGSAGEQRGGTDATVSDAKQSMRKEMRALRRSLDDRAERSRRLWSQLLGIAEVGRARRLLIFDAIPGEPETDQLRARLADSNVELAVPEDDGIQPDWPDVIVVPGLAFTTDGRRLGQGGGWYDRFLAGRRHDCITVGVCFDVQVVEHLPTEDHDVVLDMIVTDEVLA